jgi:hypothetical protein
MRSFWATRAKLSYPTKIHPALSSFADECCGMLARLGAYVGILALLAIGTLQLWQQLPDNAAVEISPKEGWNIATRSRQAFAVSQIDLPGKTETYEIFRHPEGGRKDVLRWSAPGERPMAQLEIYRPGGELDREAGIAEMTTWTDDKSARNLETAGVIESKFGAVALLRLAGRPDQPQSCLGFIKRLDEPNLRISGWSCQGDSLPARRAAISCILNRLTLLTAGNEPKLAELFARAELKRAPCIAAVAPSVSADWVMGAENPRLRGAI